MLLDGVNRVDEETYLAWTKRAVPQPGDLIVAREAPVGNVAIIPPGLSVCLGQRTVLVRPDAKKVDPQFLCYFMLGDYVQQRFKAATSGATVAHLNMRDIRGLPVPTLPALADQRRIASILSAYDDLIEVNRRRIAVLEEMARRLFEEWFVHFRFPGSAANESMPTASVDGLIDFDPATRLPREGEKPFIPMTLLSTESSLIESHEWREAGSGAKFINGDTLFARITPCLENGKTGLVRGLPGVGVGFGSTEFIVMRGKRAGPAFTYLLARHDAFRSHAQKSMSGATGRQRARTESVKTFSFASPPQALLDRFEAVTWPMLELVGQLGESNKRLAASRDLLLPRLIAGDLEVTTAERELEAIA